jgi:thioredoxin reductase
MLTEVTYGAINDQGFTVTLKNGQKQTLEADSIIPATPLSPNLKLAESLQGKVAEVYSAGDCVQDGLIIGAIADGYRIGREI